MANGIIERIHRQLKDSLKARATHPRWRDELPFVLLGMRTAWREDPECSVADLVYGSSLHIPGEFLPPVRLDPAKPSSEFLRGLQNYMCGAVPPPPAHHGSRPAQVSSNLSSTGWVYIRRDRYLPPLTRLYSGPHRIIETHDKYYVLDINGRRDTVSIDRLKVAHGQTPATAALPPPRAAPAPPAAISTPPTAAPLPTSRTGRPIRPVDRYRS